MTTALFIGRFQPFHKGHLNDVKNILKENDKIIIAIGSSQYSNIEDNPFSFEERKQMIIDVLKNESVENYEIIALPDCHNDELWIEQIKKIKFDNVYSGNERVIDIFKKNNYDLKNIFLVEGINGTTIRERIIKNDDWEKDVPTAVVNYIKKINGIEKIKKLFKT